MNDKLRELRQEKGLSQIEVAKELGIAQSTLASYETGKRVPSYDVLIAICKFYNVTSDYLLGLSEF